MYSRNALGVVTAAVMGLTVFAMHAGLQFSELSAFTTRTLNKSFSSNSSFSSEPLVSCLGLSEDCSSGVTACCDGFTCLPLGDTSVCSSPPSPTCGDGYPDSAGGEACDDANAASGDGCSASCAVEDGYECSGEPSACVRKPACRDGIDNDDDGKADHPNDPGCDSADDQDEVDPPPPCAQKDASCAAVTCCGSLACDAAAKTCVEPYCGDGVESDDEDCDDGKLDTEDCDYADGVTPHACTARACGDGYVNEVAEEECDDGNSENGDGCNAVCREEECALCEAAGEDPVACGQLPGCVYKPVSWWMFWKSTSCESTPECSDDLRCCSGETGEKQCVDVGILTRCDSGTVTPSADCGGLCASPDALPDLHVRIADATADAKLVATGTRNAFGFTVENVGLGKARNVVVTAHFSAPLKAEQLTGIVVGATCTIDATRSIITCTADELAKGASISVSGGSFSLPVDASPVPACDAPLQMSVSAVTSDAQVRTDNDADHQDLAVQCGVCCPRADTSLPWQCGEQQSGKHKFQCGDPTNPFSQWSGVWLASPKTCDDCPQPPPPPPSKKQVCCVYYKRTTIEDPLWSPVACRLVEKKSESHVLCHDISREKDFTSEWRPDINGYDVACPVDACKKEDVDLRLKKTYVGGLQPKVGDEMPYELEVTNLTADNTAVDVIVKDYHNPNLQFVRAEGATCSVSSLSKAVSCDLDNLAPGASKKFTLVFTLLERGSSGCTVTNAAYVYADNKEVAFSDNLAKAPVNAYCVSKTRHCCLLNATSCSEVSVGEDGKCPAFKPGTSEEGYDTAQICNEECEDPPSKPHACCIDGVPPLACEQVDSKDECAERAKGQKFWLKQDAICATDWCNSSVFVKKPCCDVKAKKCVDKKPEYECQQEGNYVGIGNKCTWFDACQIAPQFCCSAQDNKCVQKREGGPTCKQGSGPFLDGSCDDTCVSDKTYCCSASGYGCVPTAGGVNCKGGKFLSESCNDTCVISPMPDITIAKTLEGGLGVRMPGDKAVYVITVKNKGAERATGVTVTDFIPTGLTSLSMPSSCTNARNITCSGIDIDAGKEHVITLVFTVDPTSSYCTSQFSVPQNRALVQAELKYDKVFTNNIASAPGFGVPCPTWEVAKSGPAVTPKLGEVVEFTLTFTRRHGDYAGAHSDGTKEYFVDSMKGLQVHSFVGGANCSKTGNNILQCDLPPTAKDAVATIIVRGLVPEKQCETSRNWTNSLTVMRGKGYFGDKDAVVASAKDVQGTLACEEPPVLYCCSASGNACIERGNGTSCVQGGKMYPASPPNCGGECVLTAKQPCCLPSKQCLVKTEAECRSEKGRVILGTTCTGVDCTAPDPLVPCCTNNMCSLKTAGRCAAEGGDPKTGTACVEGMCGVPTSGGCCMPGTGYGNTCNAAIKTEAACKAASGKWFDKNCSAQCIEPVVRYCCSDKQCKPISGNTRCDKGAVATKNSSCDGACDPPQQYCCVANKCVAYEEGMLCVGGKGIDSRCGGVTGADACTKPQYCCSKYACVPYNEGIVCDPGKTPGDDSTCGGQKACDPPPKFCCSGNKCVPYVQGTTQCNPDRQPSIEKSCGGSCAPPPPPPPLQTKYCCGDGFSCTPMVQGVTTCPKPAATVKGYTKDGYDTPDECSKACSGWSVVKSVQNKQYTLGDTVTYSVTMVSGGATDITKIRVKDTLPAGMSLVRGGNTYDPGTSTTVDLGLGGVCTVSGGKALTIECPLPIAMSKKGSYLTLSITGKVTLPMCTGTSRTATNTASVWNGSSQLATTSATINVTCAEKKCGACSAFKSKSACEVDAPVKCVWYAPWELAKWKWQLFVDPVCIPAPGCPSPKKVSVSTCDEALGCYAKNSDGSCPIESAIASTDRSWWSRMTGWLGGSNTLKSLTPSDTNTECCCRDTK